MYFPADPSGILRHPSQLFEAFFEGLVLFVILWASRNIKKSNCHPEFASPVRPTARDSGSNSSLRFSQGIRFRIKSGMTTDGGLLALYSFLYGFFRFFIEFFREPDSQIGLFVGLSYGQWFSVVMMLTAFCLYFFRERRYNKCNDVQG
jgi:phosphatidylglycerol:prolipoprotein diacylglycerol transferase